ncbi:hypothetical protein A9P82_12835 [Arachidicoccus ginsenosidimutans]|nr:hypothetical protein A9P82_12835 [Arachidicoccus sp. BS20]
MFLSGLVLVHGQTIDMNRGGQLQLTTQAMVDAGGTEPNDVGVLFSNGNLANIPAHWKMSIQVIGDIHGDNGDNGASSNGNIIAPSYFQLTFNQSSANPNNPDIAQLVNNQNFLLSNGEIFVITDAPYPMVHYGYYIYLPFNLTVLPHTPFANVTPYSGSKYWFPIRARLYYTDAGGVQHVETRDLTTSNQGDLLRVLYNSSAASSVSNSIQLTAANADLYFNSTSDYINGVQVTYPDILKVVCADQNQKVDVKAGSDNLTGADNSSLPVNIVHIVASNSSSNTGNGYGFNDVQLSSTSQTLINNINQTDANGILFNLKYYINGGKITSHTSDLYSTVLYFSLDPQ